MLLFEALAVCHSSSAHLMDLPLGFSMQGFQISQLSPELIPFGLDADETCRPQASHNLDKDPNRFNQG